MINRLQWPQLFLISLAFLFAACGGALPANRSSAALHRDLERLVTLADAEGWTIDRYKYEEALPWALMSVCQVSTEARAELLAWLDSQIARRGSLEEEYKRKGKDLGAVEDLLVLTRVRMLLGKSLETISEDCPFWLPEKQHFKGRQILDDRWIFSVGGGGKAMAVRQAGETDFNFGGAGRLLLGRGFGRHATLFTGIETGGIASFPRNENGERGNLTLAVDVVIPLVYRHRLVNTYWEVEAGYVAHTTEEELTPSHGMHFGASFGGSTARRRWLFPGAAFGISYERITEDRILHAVKLGFRVAIDFAK